MPNHIKNRLTFSGDQSKINELVTRFSTFHPAKQRTSFDGELTFEKEGNCGWLATDGSFSYRENGKMKTAPKILDGYTPSMRDEWTQFPDFNKVISAPNDDAYNDLPSQRVSALSPNWWHTWNVEHWGTKWNAYSCEKGSENIWEFDTAWSGVPKIVSEIAKAFPEIEIVYEYSDEDTGSNCGIYTYKDGELLAKNILESGTKEAYDLAFKLRPYKAEDYVLVGGNYEYKDDEDE